MPTNFNQDATCLALYNSEYTRIYYCDPLGKCYEGGGSFKVEMLFSTSLITSIDISQRSITILNTKKQSVICELAFNSTVVNVKMNRKRVIVELQDQLMIYDVSNMKLIHTIHLPNTKVALASDDSSLIAYQHSKGQITLFDSINLKPVHHFHPHSVDIQLMTFSIDGMKLATSSTNGTVIKIYDLKTFELINELRRGSTRAIIDSIAFNNDILILSSSHSTIHLFNLQKPVNKEAGRRFPIPNQITSYLTPDRNFSTLKIPDFNRGKVAIGNDVFYIATDHHLMSLKKNGELINSIELT